MHNVKLFKWRRQRFRHPIDTKFNHKLIARWIARSTTPSLKRNNSVQFGMRFGLSLSAFRLDSCKSINLAIWPWWNLYSIIIRIEMQSVRCTCVHVISFRIDLHSLNRIGRGWTMDSGWQVKYNAFHPNDSTKAHRIETNWRHCDNMAITTTKHNICGAAI